LTYTGQPSGTSGTANVWDPNGGAGTSVRLYPMSGSTSNLTPWWDVPVGQITNDTRIDVLSPNFNTLSGVGVNQGYHRVILYNNLGAVYGNHSGIYIDDTTIDDLSISFISPTSKTTAGFQPTITISGYGFWPTLSNQSPTNTQSYITFSGSTVTGHDVIFSDNKMTAQYNITAGDAWTSGQAWSVTVVGDNGADTLGGSLTIGTASGLV